MVPEHLREWWGYGTFFLAVAGLQGAYALALLRRPRGWLLPAGIVGHLALLGLYIVTRTSGVPLLGPHAGEIEPVGAIDLLSKFLELSLVVVLTTLRRAPYRSRTASA